MENQKIRLNNGDVIAFSSRSMVYKTLENRKVLSTSPLNGGVREDIQTVFNYDETPPNGQWCKMKADTYEDHLKIVSKELGLDPAYTTGLSTTAHVNHSAVRHALYHGSQISVVCTAGLDVNASRAGEPAGFDEVTYTPDCHKGTVNLFLFADFNLLNGTMARLLVTMTEAKTAAIQALNIRSSFSDNLATGSGTDGIVVVCSPGAEILLSNAGTHSKFGEIVSNLVRDAVKDALFKQTGLDAKRQTSLSARLKGYDLETCNLAKVPLEIHDNHLIPVTSMALRLIEEVQWGLLTVPMGLAGLELLRNTPVDGLHEKLDLALPESPDAFKAYVLAYLKSLYALSESAHDFQMISEENTN